eukprot:NODE_5701_length_1742_cov_15.980186.p1 GENE.NODE_5701_length_1742_cov_15.980186~~NODE_5701_length_1742_cov_15.980186.p1  ORF type:complete len:421 (+),score=131.96 NODE_5701_length_1742_cov_15.980186:299-1561(+)
MWGITGGLGLKALLCCIFDKDEGPIVLCSDPPNSVAAQFNALKLGRYLLPESFVRSRVVSVRLDDNVVLGAPVMITDSLYDRNCFQFNICVVIGSNLDAQPYRDLAQNLAMAFKPLEVDMRLLSRAEERATVQQLITTLRSQLRESSECFAVVGESHCVSFCVRDKPLALATELKGSDIPLPLVDLNHWLESRDDIGGPVSVQPDSSFRYLAQFVDGLRTVLDIVHDSGLDEALVHRVLWHLCYFDLVAPIGSIELAQRFCLTPAFHRAFQDEALRAEVVPYVTAGRRKTSDVLIERIEVLYASIDGWPGLLRHFRDANAKTIEQLGISLRHFIVFGLLHGFLQSIGTVVEALTAGETEELERIRRDIIPSEKEKLRNAGMPIESVNRDPHIRALVARMNALKAREKRLARVTASGDELG